MSEGRYTEKSAAQRNREAQRNLAERRNRTAQSTGAVQREVAATRSGAATRSSAVKRSGGSQRSSMTHKSSVARRKNALLKKKSARYRRYRRKRMMIIAVAVIILLLIAFGIGKGVQYILHKREVARQIEEEQRIAEEIATEPKEITIGATGCMLLHGPILRSDWYSSGNGTYDFSDIYKYIKPKYSKPDFMTCEFEGTLTGSDYSGYPSFQSPDILVQNIADSGVDLQLLATNHMYDASSFGFRRTVETFENMHLNYTGARKNVESKRYFVTEIDEIKVGFLNYVYESEGAEVALNMNPVTKDDQPLINTFDYKELDKFYKEVEESITAMKEEGAQFLIANMHWGTEYQLKEDNIQQTIAQKLCDMGINALIGGHPHCEQPIDMLESPDGNQMFCIYSVGNALSNQRKELISEMPTGHTEDGVMVTLTIRRERDMTVALKDAEILPTWVYRQDTDQGNRYYILPLDDVSSLENTTGLSGIRQEAEESYIRTMDELGPGLKKVKEMLQKKQEVSEENTTEETTAGA